MGLSWFTGLGPYGSSYFLELGDKPRRRQASDSNVIRFVMVRLRMCQSGVGRRNGQHPHSIKTVGFVELIAKGGKRMITILMRKLIGKINW